MNHLLVVLALLLLASPVTAQPIQPNNVKLTGTSGSTYPKIVANGPPATLGVNVITKGGACLQVNGVCVAGGGGGTCAAGSADTICLAGSATGDPVTITASGTDTNVSIKMLPKRSDGATGQGFIQFGPDTYGSAGWIGYDLISELYRLTSTNTTSIGHYVEMVSADVDNAQVLPIQIQVTTGPSTHDLYAVYGIRAFGRSELGVGGTLQYLIGGSFEASATSGDIVNIYGVSQETTFGGTATVDTAYGVYTNVLSSGTPAIDTYYSLWAPDLPTTIITNPYYLWFDSRGVFRIRQDTTFDSVAQAIPALYNPQFTKYTPGATNFERVTMGQWNGNVAEIGTEKGGSGTLRGLRLIGASVSIPTTIAALGTASTTTGTIGFKNGTNANTFTLSSPVTTTSWTMTPPVAAPAGNNAHTLTSTTGAQTFQAAGISQTLALCTGVSCATTCSVTFTNGIAASVAGTCP